MVRTRDGANTGVCSMLTLWEPITHLSRSNSVLNSVQLLRTQSVGTPSAVRTVALLLIGGLNCLPAGLC